jgi:hypothetical protein
MSSSHLALALRASWTRPGAGPPTATKIIEKLIQLTSIGTKASYADRINTVDVRLATAFLQGRSRGKGPAADYIALGSLRCNIETLIASPGGTAGLPFDIAQQDSHATTPAQMAGLLEQAGRQNVQNRAMADYLAPRNGPGLQTAGGDPCRTGHVSSSHGHSTASACASSAAAPRPRPRARPRARPTRRQERVVGRSGVPVTQ